MKNSVEWGPLGETVYGRTYSRPKEGGGSESWPETVERVVDGNLELAGLLGVGSYEREELVERMRDFRILPGGRHLWASGAKSKLGLFNCWRSGWGPGLADHFVFTFDQLMLGGGVGANYSSDYLAPLQRVNRGVRAVFRMDTRHPDRKAFVDSGLVEHGAEGHYVYHVEDSREGWVSALRHLFAVATQEGGVVRGTVDVVFDVSAVRGYGAPIVGFGGTASGPVPLMRLLAAVAGVLSETVGRSVTPLEAMRIDHEIAACVVAGNVRRSARMSILHWRDPHIMEFLECKKDGAQHWSTNISVEVDGLFWEPPEGLVGHRDRVLGKIAEGMHRNGEPGIYNSELAAVGEHSDVRATNPCGEITLNDWEMCNLGHVNLAHPAHLDPEHLLESFRLMARFTTRATLGNATSMRSDVVKAFNRRIGVGVFGFQEWLAGHGMKFSDVGTEYAGVAERLNEWRDAVREAANECADALGISRPVKVTTVAPTGSIAKLPGVSEGIHPVYAKRFVRRVRYGALDPELARLKAEGHPVEPCIYSANTEVVSFFVEDSSAVKFGDLIEDVSELSLDELLMVQALFQAEFADNAVSFTANFVPGALSVEDLESALLRWGPLLKGTTAFPEMGMAQSPMERLSEEDWISVGSAEVGQSLDDLCASGACPVR